MFTWVGWTNRRTVGADLLNTRLLDHVVWVQALEPFGKDASLAATWIDGYGQNQVFAVNQAFLAAHLRILRSVMHDLATGGPEGQRLIRDIVAEHLPLLKEQDDTSSRRQRIVSERAYRLLRKRTVVRTHHARGQSACLKDNRL